jgi:hypothetical protein
MSVDNLPEYLKNVDADQLKTAAARRFAQFCLQDFPTHTNADGFDPVIYDDAAKLVISRLEAMRFEEGDAA